MKTSGRVTGYAQWTVPGGHPAGASRAFDAPIDQPEQNVTCSTTEIPVQDACPVVAGSDFCGLVTIEDVSTLPRADWERTTVSAVMHPDTATGSLNWTLRQSRSRDGRSRHRSARDPR